MVLARSYRILFLIELLITGKIQRLRGWLGHSVSVISSFCLRRANPAAVALSLESWPVHAKRVQSRETKRARKIKRVFPCPEEGRCNFFLSLKKAFSSRV